MKIKIAVVLVIGLCLGGIAGYHIDTVHAQSATALTITAQLPSTSCPAIASGVTQICFTSDKGVIQSINGAAYVATGVGATGPAGPAGANGTNGATGPQGLTGPQGPQGPAGTSSSGVTSVNGQTGAVTISIQ